MYDRTVSINSKQSITNSKASIMPNYGNYVLRKNKSLLNAKNVIHRDIKF